MQEFLDRQRVAQRKRGAEERLKDFKEIYMVFDEKEASTQATRCVQCGDPYCHNTCPLHNYIPFWLRSTSILDNETAFALSNESNPFPEITGRICPQDRLCEGSCTLNEEYGAVTIGAIETFISEEGFKNGRKPSFPEKKTNKKVAVIGSGPTGIAAATFLMRSGINVTMYERQSHPGGLLTFGIPNFKLEKEVVFRRIEWLKQAGMELHLNTKVGVDISFEEIKDNFDGVFLGIGAEVSRKPNIPNENAKNVYEAIEFLRNMQKKVFSEEYDSYYDVKDKNVVVIGGGDTAMDCLRTSLREGAKSVKCLYRRDRANMPGSKKEFQNATEEGAEFIFNASPKEIIVNNDNETIGIMMEKTIMGEKDASGRQRMEVVKDSDFKVEADVLIFALGFVPEAPNFLAENGIQLDKYNCIEVDENRETSKKGIWAGGDCFRGADLVVRAAFDGRTAAKSIVKSLLD